MAFITVKNTVISLAEYDDVALADQRLFDTNEGLSQELVEDMLIRASDRIASQLRASKWWTTRWNLPAPSTPAVSLDKIRARMNQFVDLCVAVALSEYILPRIADFGNTESAEVRKIAFYSDRAANLLRELVRQ